MRTHNTPRLCAGPQTAGTPIKFWNVASTGDDEGEITLYGLSLIHISEPTRPY